MKVKKITSWVLTIIVGAAFGLIGVSKLGGMAAGMFEDWGYPGWFARVIGVAELAGAVLLIVPRTMGLGVVLLSCVMAGAAVTHLANGEGLQVLRPAMFASALWLALWLRSGADAEGSA